MSRTEKKGECKVAVKKYPFSAEKHAHDIEFRCNRLFCEMHDMEVGTIEMDEVVYDEMYELRDRLQDLLLAVLGTRDNAGIAWLTGPEIGLAKETVAWAGAMRDATYVSKQTEVQDEDYV